MFSGVLSQNSYHNDCIEMDPHQFAFSDVQLDLIFDQSIYHNYYTHFFLQYVISDVLLDQILSNSFCHIQLNEFSSFFYSWLLFNFQHNF